MDIRTRTIMRSIRLILGSSLMITCGVRHPRAEDDDLGEDGYCDSWTSGILIGDILIFA